MVDPVAERRRKNAPPKTREWDDGPAPADDDSFKKKEVKK